MRVSISIPPPVAEVVRRISQRGGRALLVGGAVIDSLQGRVVTDWDIEVFGLSYDDLNILFADLAPKTVGKAFGILSVSPGEGVEIDLSVPRRDSKIGVGHKDFAILVDHTLTPVEAARRRDFTINAMALDLVSGELIDPFGGRKDMEEGILRVTDPATFGEDPLRALRAMQLLARKARRVDPQTAEIIRGMVSEFPFLPRERVYEEFRKLLLKAERPSMGLEFLRDSGWIIHFPELEALIGCLQNPEWHPEGDVWVHTLLVVDAGAQVRHLIPESQREGFMFGLLCHDFGKPGHTQEGLVAPNHDLGGVAPAESFIRRMTDSTKLLGLVCGIVKLHMRPWHLFVGDAKRGTYARLHREMQAAGGDLRLLGWVSRCDACASGVGRSLAGGEPNWSHEVSRRLMAFAEEFELTAEAVQPKVMGRDLIAAGLKPGPMFKRLLDAALDIQDSDSSLGREDILARVLPLAASM